MDEGRGDGAGVAQRFTFVRCLGRGGFGEVWEVQDNQRGNRAALKILHNREPSAVRRFKNEFRRLSEISHPNLVSLFDFVSDGSSWAFTMELIEGTDFVEHVRGSASVDDDATTVLRPSRPDLREPPSGRSCEVALSKPGRDRLRAALPQLIDGLDALHARGLLHRDVKPSNVLVTPLGRVVLVDFGLARDLGAGLSTRPGEFIGTPAYMAPELLLGQPASAASDLYAVGVLLFEVLTGQLPFEGRMLGRLAMSVPSMEAGSDDPDARFWVDLCQEMLAPDPKDRTDASELLRRLGVRRRPTSAWSTERPEALVGRGFELSRLESAAGRRRAKPEVILLTGPSGIGKTRLLRALVSSLRSSSAHVVSMGRCYERETVPFKALDVLLDDLVAELSSRPELLVGGAGQLDLQALMNVFPVLRELPGLVPASFQEGFEASPRTFGSRAMAQLVDLLGALATRGPLTLVLDDAQWGDTDSAAVLAELVSSGPPLLLVLSVRETRGAPSDFLRTFLDLSEASRLLAQIALSLLSEVDSERLARACIDEEREGASILAKKIAREGKGSPLLVTELARHAMTSEDETSFSGAIEDLFAARIEPLEAPALEVLKVVAVAGRPIREELAVAAAQLAAEDKSCLLILRNQRLLTTTRQGNATFIELVHDRFRDYLTSQLEEERLASIHLRLAQAIEAATPDAVDSLALHLRASGQEERAAHFSVLAARRALERNALRDAAAHYRAALELRESVKRSTLRESPEEGSELDVEYAQVLRRLGDYETAIRILEGCQSSSPQARRLDSIRVQLGTIYQERGDIARATRELEQTLESLGLAPPRSALATRARVVAEILILALRPASRWWRPSGALGENLDDCSHLLFVLMRIYYFGDLAKLMWAGLTARNLSNYLDNELRLVEAYCNYGALLFGLGKLTSARRWCLRSVELARGQNDPGLLAIALSRLGTCEVFAHDLEAAKRALDEAIDRFDQAGYEMWELQTALMLLGTSHFLGSEIQPALRVFGRMGAVARRLGAVRHRAWELAWTPFCRYLIGVEPASAVRESLEQAFELSGSIGDIANQCAARMHLTLVDARERALDACSQGAFETFSLISRYHVPVPFLQIALVAAAEAAMVVLESGEQISRRPALERLVRRSLRRAGLVARFYPYLRGPSARMRARYLAYKGRWHRADKEFARAVAILEEADNKLDLARTYIDWARFSPSRSDIKEKGRSILLEIGAVGEAERLISP